MRLQHENNTSEFSRVILYLNCFKQVTGPDEGQALKLTDQKRANIGGLRLLWSLRVWSLAAI